jgi:hypothetical protein
MNEVSPGIRDLARRLVAQEALTEQGSESPLAPTLRAVEKLRIPLTKVAGTQGFRSLLARALTLANAYAPSLGPLRIGNDGSLQGAVDPPAPQTASEAADGGTALLAEMIGLLLLFIGETLTLQLLRASWPDVSLQHIRTEQKETRR